MQNRTLFLSLATLLAVPAFTGCNSGGVDVSPGHYAAFRVASVGKGVETGDCGTVDPNPTSTHTSNLRAGGTFLVYGVADESTIEQLYLDVGGQVLVGSQETDGTYVFKGNIVDTHQVGGKTITDSDHDGVDDLTQSFVDADNDGLNDRQTVANSDPMVDTDNDGLDDRNEDSLVDANHDGKDDRIVTLPGDTTLTSRHDITVRFTADGDAIKGQNIDTASSSCDGSLCDGIDNLSCTVTTAFVGVDVQGASVSLPVDGQSSNPAPQPGTSGTSGTSGTGA